LRGKLLKRRREKELLLVWERLNTSSNPKKRQNIIKECNTIKYLTKIQINEKTDKNDDKKLLQKIAPSLQVGDYRL